MDIAAKILVLLSSVLYLLSACAEVKEAGRSIGHTTRNVTRDIGHGSRDTVSCPRQRDKTGRQVHHSRPLNCRTKPSARFYRLRLEGMASRMGD